MGDKKSVILERFQRLLDDSGCTRQAIANDLGCDTSTVTKQYNGDMKISVDYLVKYANYFNVSSDYLLGLTETKTQLYTEEQNALRISCDYTKLNENTIKQITKRPIYPLLIDLLFNNSNFETFESFCVALAFISYYRYLANRDIAKIKNTSNTSEISEDERLRIDNLRFRAKVTEYEANKDFNKLFDSLVAYFKKSEKYKELKEYGDN